MQVQKACDDALEMGLDLEQIYMDQNPEFSIQARVKRNATPRFVHD